METKRPLAQCREMMAKANEDGIQKTTKKDKFSTQELHILQNGLNGS